MIKQPWAQRSSCIKQEMHKPKCEKKDLKQSTYIFNVPHDCVSSNIHLVSSLMHINSSHIHLYYWCTIKYIKSILPTL